MKMPDLLSCPDCREKPILYAHVGYWREFMYICPNCFSKEYKQPIVRDYSKTKKKAAQRWNAAVKAKERYNGRNDCKTA